MLKYKIERLKLQIDLMKFFVPEDKLREIEQKVIKAIPCPCNCCLDKVIGCLCMYFPEEERCDCEYCQKIISEAACHCNFPNSNCCGIFNNVNSNNEIICNECGELLSQQEVGDLNKADDQSTPEEASA